MEPFRPGPAGSRRRPRTLALLVLLALVASLGLGTSGPAGAGVPPQDARVTFTYEIRFAGNVYGNRDDSFDDVVAAALADQRGWSLGGSVRFVEDPFSGPVDFRIWLAGPTAVEGFGGACTRQYSCTVGDDVVINDARWRTATPTWPDLHEYRTYVVNHEVGHWLGLRHLGCPSRGTTAPVMVDQSRSLGGCLSGTWPSPGEKRAVATRLAVPVRSAAPDLYAVKQHGGTGTEVHVLDGASMFARFRSHHSTVAANTTPADWDFSAVDRDRDGVDDIVGVKRNGASGHTEVHVLDGASGYTAWQLNAVTPLPVTDGDWTFDVGDYRFYDFSNGHVDVFAFEHRGDEGTEVTVLNGLRDFETVVTQVALPMPQTDPDEWVLRVGDHDRDGVDDIYAIKRLGNSGRTEVHVLDGEGGWRRFSRHAATPLPHTDALWDFQVADHDGDGYDDVYGIKRRGNSSRTEVHVLADRTYDRFAAHMSTVLPPTDGVPGWRFLVD